MTVINFMERQKSIHEHNTKVNNSIMWVIQKAVETYPHLSFNKILIMLGFNEITIDTTSITTLKCMLDAMGIDYNKENEDEIIRQIE